MPAAADPKAGAQAVFDKVADAFNKKDAKAFTALWADDGTLINPGGVVGKGKAEIEKVVGEDMKTILKDTKTNMDFFDSMKR